MEYHPWDDWNGDGVVDWQDSVLATAMLQFQLDQLEEMEQRCSEQKRRIRNMHMVDLIREYGKPVLEFDDFYIICHDNGYSTAEFTQEDLDEIQSELNNEE